MTPARIAGEWVYDDHLSEGRLEQAGELQVSREGARSSFVVTSDDSRFGGPAEVTSSWEGHWPPALVALVDAEWVVGDADGRWTGHSRSVASMADEDPLNAPEQVFFDGSGEFEGLTAYVIIDHEYESFVGVILPDVMPELPADWMEIWQEATSDDPAGAEPQG